MQRQQEDKSVGFSRLAGSQVPIAGPLSMLAPKTTVEQQDVVREPAKKREFEDIAPNKVLLRSELAEVKSLCQHWNFLKIINDVATKTMKDQTGRKTYVCLVPATMHIEPFKRVHGHDTGHFGYAKIYPLFSE